MNFFDMLVSKSINGGGGGSGTSNYNDLSNKPSINSVTLTGNKTASALGLQPEITGDVKISSDNVDDTGATNLFVTSDEKSTWSGKQDALTFDDAPTENSNNPVKSGGIYTALSGKQATLTFDDSPTSGSSNPVKSGGVYTALGNKQDTVTFDGTYSASTNKAATVSTVTNAVNALDVTGGNVAASKTLASWSETNGKVSVTTQDIAITGSQAVLTGYSIAQSKQSIAATDTATEAFGKVEQRVQTNENNILTLQQRTGKVSATQSIGTDYTLVSDVYFHAGAAKAIRLTAAIQFINSAPRGIIISKSNNSSNYNNATNLIAKTETTESINMLSVTGFGSASADTTYYVWAKSAEAANNAVYLLYDDFTS